jgi:HD-like signal output (HDOD) protein
LRVRQLAELPPVSPVAQRLIALLVDENVQVGPLARTIELDPALTARIVGLSRSAYFGYAGAIYTVRDAIVRVLGLSTVRSLALSLVLTKSLRPGDTEGFDPYTYWSTALLTGTSARAMVPHLSVPKPPTPDGAYLCGLLHQLGLLAMFQVFPQEMAAVVASAPGADDTELTDAEQAALGVDHHQVGGWLADRWHLPGEVVIVLEHHHERGYLGPQWPSVRLVGACRRAVGAVLCRGSCEPEDTADLEVLGVGEAGLAALREVFDRQLHEVRALATGLAEPL